MAAEENNNSNGDPQDLVLDDVVEVAPDELSDEQKTFLQENADDLSDEQKEIFKDVLEEDEEEEETEPETRIKPPKKPDKPGDGDDDEDDPEDDPEDVAAIGKIVDEKTAGLKEQIQTQTNATEVDALIRSKPEYGKYRTAILKHMSHPAYANVPAHNIAAIVSSNDQQKIGAQKEREAAEKAAETKGGGSSARKPTGAKVDWDNATPEQVATKKQEILDQSRE